MGNVTVHGVSALQVLHLYLTKRSEHLEENKKYSPSFISCPMLHISNDSYVGHHSVKKQRWNMSTVYVKQQMVELHNLKCYICVYISQFH